MSDNDPTSEQRRSLTWPTLSDTQWLRINRRLRPDWRPRAIIVRVANLVARVELGSCAWCAAYDGPICSACGAKADRARVSLACTVKKSAARVRRA
jgi:hypothetical protein